MKSTRAIKRQGNKAEKEVSQILRGMGRNYHVFDNVMLKTNKQGGTTQIDHVVVSPFGIFVIETKSHKGKVYGDCVGKYWTQCLYNKRGTVDKYQFYSPYFQNAGHLKNLYKLTGLDCRFFLGLIVFTSDEINLIDCKCPNVCHANDLAQYMYSYKQRILSDAQVNEIIGQLKKNNIQSAYFDKKHVKYVKSMQKGSK